MMRRFGQIHTIPFAVLFGLGVVFFAGWSSVAQGSGKLADGMQAQRAYAEGVDRYKVKDYAGAIPQFARALKLLSDFDDAEALLAWSYYYTGNYPEATRHFRQTLIRQPEWEGLHSGLGWSRYQVGRYHLALEAFRQALALDSSYRDAAVGFVYSLFELGRYAEALPHLERLTQEGEANMLKSAAPDLEQVRSRYAWVLLYLGDYSKARDQFAKAIVSQPEWSGLYNGLGWSYLRLGDKVRAHTSFQRALQLQPNLSDAKDGLAQVGRGVTIDKK